MRVGSLLRPVQKALWRVKPHCKDVRSPFAIDAHIDADWSELRGRKILFDGVFKGEYSLAIVNRELASSLIAEGLDVDIVPEDESWQSDTMLRDMPAVFQRSLPEPLEGKSYDIHLRNTWPPRTEDMIGKNINAYVCFAWEESVFPSNIVRDFNAKLDLVLTTSNFVSESLISSGVKIAVETVGNGTDHFLRDSACPATGNDPTISSGESVFLHVSSCFPRKGVDVLIETFCRTFSEEEKCRLVIKTFDNPHNQVDALLSAAKERYPRSAPVEIIKTTYTSRQMNALISSARVFVSPSRGEGFGLPLAEALLLGVPVITTNYSGQTDFCTSETAWLVDYSLQPSMAHVASGNSVWAEPSQDSLATAMRAALRETASSARMVRNGQELLKAHFKWSDVSRRVAHAVSAEVRRKSRRKPRMDLPSVDLVSTWQQVCGIASYSEHLFETDTLRPLLRNVLARQLTSDARDDRSPPAFDHVKLIRPWGYDREGILRLQDTVRGLKSDVLWLQHHPGFFSSQDMEALTSDWSFGRGRTSGPLRVVTLHNVQEVLKGEANWLSRFDAIFVHTPEDASAIARSLTLNSVVIPHGIKLSACRRDPPPGFVVGAFGFLYPHKNVPILIQAVAIARNVIPGIRLSLTTSVRRDQPSLREQARVEALIDRLDLRQVVDVEYSFLTDGEIHQRLSDCSILCLPYGESNESATGAGRIALSVDRPLICSRSRVLDDLQPLSIVLNRINPYDLAEAIILMYSSEDVRRSKDVVRRKYVNEHSYESMARRYVEQIMRLDALRPHAS